MGGTYRANAATKDNVSMLLPVKRLCSKDVGFTALQFNTCTRTHQKEEPVEPAVTHPSLARNCRASQPPRRGCPPKPATVGMSAGEGIGGDVELAAPMGSGEKSETACMVAPGHT